MKERKVITSIQKHLSVYIKKSKLKSLVIGVSGGIDSTLCCALALPVCEKLGIPLIGRSLPIHSKKVENDRAKKVGESFCTKFKEYNLTPLYIFMLGFFKHTPGEFLEKNTDSQQIKIVKGNIKARLRMIHLYDIAAKNKGMVLSTDNYTEHLLGFWTLHGDVGDFGMIQNLWKTEVYQLSKYILHRHPILPNNKYDALEESINAVPTDGLGITDSDLDQLEAETYEEVDKILQDYLDPGGYDNDRYYGPDKNKLEKSPVIQRHINSGFKRKNPYNIERKSIGGLND